MMTQKMTIEAQQAKVERTGAEDHLRTFIETVAEGYGWHVSHVESPITSPGIPDLNICHGQSDLWIELKVRKRGGVHMRPPQRLWHRRRAEAGGRSYVLAYIDGSLYLHRGDAAAAYLPKSKEWKQPVPWELDQVAEMLRTMSVGHGALA